MEKGELWILKLPFKNGKEQRGIRPCLVIGDTQIMTSVIPITSNLQALRFPYTIEIKKSKENGLEKNSIALVFQVQSLDKKRFVNKIGILEHSCISQINDMLRKLFQL